METNGKLFYSFIYYFKGKFNVHPEMKTNWRWDNKSRKREKLEMFVNIKLYFMLLGWPYIYVACMVNATS